MENAKNEVFFPSYFRSKGDKQPFAIEWKEVVRLIKDDPAVAHNTQMCREARAKGDAALADRYKAASGGITPAVCCEGGHGRKNIIGHTGYSLVDLDHVPPACMADVLTLVRNDPHTFMTWTTVSGEGVRVLFKWEGEAFYLAAWRKGNDYYAALTGVPADEQTKDDVRLSFLCHDADVLYRPEAEPFVVTKEDSQNAQPTKRAHPKENVAVTDALFDKAIRLVERQGIVYMSGQHNTYVMRVGYLLNKMGVSEREAADWASARFSDYDRAAEIIGYCYRHTEEHGTWRESGSTRPVQGGSASGSADQTPATSTEEPRKKGGHKREATEKWASVTDIKLFLDEHTSLRYNTIANITEYEVDDEWKPINDRYVNSLWTLMGAEGQMCRIQDMWNVIQSNYVRTYDPFADFFDHLPAWDASSADDPIGALAARVHTTAGAECFARFFRKWFVGVVASLRGRSVNQSILVLLGRQGIFKTTFMRRLLPPEWQTRYFYTKTNSQRLGRDDIIALAEYALICLEEIDHLRTEELNQLKAMVTMEDIHERPAYGRVRIHRRHIASFCATGNNLNFLTDPTGNRRWIPFEVTSIDNPFVYAVDYPALYAQAVSLLESGFPYWFDADEMRELNVHNTAFEVPCLEEEMLSRYFRHPTDSDTGLFMTATEILEICNVGLRMPLNINRIGMSLKKLGYTRIYLNRKYGYRVICRTRDEIDNTQKTEAIAAREQAIPFAQPADEEECVTA